ncbi:hypothetical protein NE237_031031 [Protea cynaroides]|uniref:Late embryogenesis abundant protein LEA-2 subgroup domain-containing protein n=1 Tax=Protea cynaroides TaxID=273540 RepID=A0A9Q0JVF4_9MAGN|nr:hypothetical protein NE237_031031 [Protea cynaroides]
MDLMLAKEDGPTRPLAPNPKKRNAWVICLLIFLGTIILLALILVILALTVFKAKDVTVSVNSFKVKNLHSSIDPLPSMKAYLNATIILDLSVHNPNKVSFKYRHSTAEVEYNSVQVGEATFPDGNVPSDGTAGVNTTVTILADRLLSDSSFYSDVVSGSVPLSIYTTIAGKIKVLIIKKHVTTHTSCNITLNLQTWNVTDTQCKSKVSL